MSSPTFSKTGKAVNKMRRGNKENTILLWKWSVYGSLAFHVSLEKLPACWRKCVTAGNKPEPCCLCTSDNIIFQGAKGTFQPLWGKCNYRDSLQSPSAITVLVSFSHDRERARGGGHLVVPLKDNTFLCKT